MLEFFVLGLFCAFLLLCVLFDLSILWALSAGLILFCVYAKIRKCTWKELLKMLADGAKTTKNVMIVLVLIGVLTALWRSAGTIPVLIVYAIRLIRPQSFILLTFLLNCGVSLLTGTAFGTAATMGVITMTMSNSMGIQPFLTGGAILSGIFFGDRCSPVSTSALLVSELTGTDIYANIKKMIKTAAVPFVLTCGLYLAMGFGADAATETPDLATVFGAELQLHPIALLPAVVIIVLSLFKCKVKLTMLVSIAVSIPICLFLQHTPPLELLQTAVSGFVSTTQEATPMLNGGGITSMLKSILTILISSAFSGIFHATPLLKPLKAALHRLDKCGTPFVGMIVTGILTSLIACTQVLAIILTHQIYGEDLESRDEEAIDLENTATTIAALIPWSIACSVPLASVGAPVLSVVAACYLYILPLWNLLVSLVKRKHTAKPEAAAAV